MNCGTLLNNSLDSLIRRELYGSSVSLCSAVDQMIQDNISQGICSSYQLDLGCSNSKEELRMNRRFLAFGGKGIVGLFDLFQRKLLWKTTYPYDGCGWMCPIHLSERGMVVVNATDYFDHIFFDGKETGRLSRREVIRRTIRIVDEKIIAVSKANGIHTIAAWDRSGSRIEMTNDRDSKLIFNNVAEITYVFDVDASHDYYVIAVKIDMLCIGFAFDLITGKKRILKFSENDDYHVQHLTIQGNSLVVVICEKWQYSRRKILQMNLLSGDIEFEYPVAQEDSVPKKPIVTHDYIAYISRRDFSRAAMPAMHSLVVINRKTQGQHAAFPYISEHSEAEVSSSGDFINIVHPDPTIGYKLVVIKLPQCEIINVTNNPLGKSDYPGPQFQYGRLVNFIGHYPDTRINIVDYLPTVGENELQ